MRSHSRAVGIEDAGWFGIRRFGAGWTVVVLAAWLGAAGCDGPWIVKDREAYNATRDLVEYGTMKLKCYESIRDAESARQAIPELTRIHDIPESVTSFFAKQTVDS
ncbi:MAG: hypothetical protein FJ297_11425 [Planctomycetes bacterium]|nr:hypothetical protein [Planctomycetota bacterium]